jgi:hypothetical protein
MLSDTNEVMFVDDEGSDGSDEGGRAGMMDLGKWEVVRNCLGLRGAAAEKVQARSAVPVLAGGAFFLGVASIIFAAGAPDIVPDESISCPASVTTRQCLEPSDAILFARSSYQRLCRMRMRSRDPLA